MARTESFEMICRTVKVDIVPAKIESSLKFRELHFLHSTAFHSSKSTCYGSTSSRALRERDARGVKGERRQGKLEVASVETREGKIRMFEYNRIGDIDRHCYVLNAYANSTQNSNYRFIVTRRRMSGKADKSVSSQPRARILARETRTQCAFLILFV